MAQAFHLDWAVQRFTGLTGNASVNFQPFDMTTYGITTLTRFVLEVDAIAMRTDDLGATYNDVYMVRSVMTYNPAIPSLSDNDIGIIRDTTGSGSLVWSIGASSGNPVIHTAGLATLTSTYTVSIAARITSWLFR